MENLKKYELDGKLADEPFISKKVKLSLQFIILNFSTFIQIPQCFGISMSQFHFLPFESVSPVQAFVIFSNISASLLADFRISLQSSSKVHPSFQDDAKLNV